MIRVIHYRNKCIGCFACVAVAPSTWRMSKKDGKSVLLGSVEKKGAWSVLIEEDEWKENTTAEKMCPARVIQVRRY